MSTYEYQKEMKKYTIEFLQSIEGQIMIAESIQTWDDKNKEKAKQDYIKLLKSKKTTPCIGKAKAATGQQSRGPL